MDTRNRKRWIGLFTLLVFTTSMLVGCSVDDDVSCPDEQPPEIPPVSTFVMDFSDFTESTLAQSPLKEAMPSTTGYPGSNWTWAAVNIFVWNTVLTVGLAIPVAAFVESFNHEPVQRTDGTWVWDYNFYVASVLYLAELHGKVTDDEVQWTMYISKQDAYSDFLWFSGESNLSATEGTWALNNSPDDPTPLVGILWHRDPDAGTADIRYTNIVPDGPENGGYIYYGTTGETPFDAFYDIYNKGQDNHTDIEWNRTTKAGRVRDPLHFGDGDWHCWDSNRDNAECQ